ncbi:MAG: hypothetical protein RR949_05425 [Oscillospiraceae bacterium]
MLKYSVELSEEDLGLMRVALLASIDDYADLAQNLEIMAEDAPTPDTRAYGAAESARRRSDVVKMRRILSSLYRLRPILPQGGEINHV